MPDASPTGFHATVMDLNFETPDGPLRARVAIPNGPMRLAELAFNAMQLDSKIVELAVKREERKSRKISCCAGCGACCRQLVPLSPPEAWMVADVFAALRPERRAIVGERFANAVKTIGEHGLREAVMAVPSSDREAIDIARQYFTMGVPCPFLEEESCSIHPARPSVCREYLVTSNPARCAELFTRGVLGVKMPILLSRALGRLAAELLGGAPVLVPLTLALEWASANREDGLREWDAKMMLERLLALICNK